MSIVLHGVAAGKGIAIGHAHLITRGTTEVPQYDIDPDKLDAEVTRFDNAIKA
ncbi:phosphoenolpyruvate-utilizing N-terminal domain-containing protein, partial [Neisseria sp. P0006.S006]